MTKTEQTKNNSDKPPKPAPVSRLSELANANLKVVTAGAAFDHDLSRSKEPASGTKPPSEPENLMPPVVSITPRKAPDRLNSLIKRTFRYPMGLNSDLKKFVHRYNLEKREDEPELSMEEIGILMAKHFLASDPAKIARESRGQ
jgi:hypothetical protein